MPSFTTQSPNLHANGPVVEFRILPGRMAIEAIQKAGNPSPKPVPAIGMIDTGASNSVIQMGIAAQLGLNPVGVTRISTPSSTDVQCYEYLVQFVFPNNVVFETTAIEAPLEGQNIQCLIGREVLAHAVLVYIGYANLFSLSF